MGMAEVGVDAGFGDPFFTLNNMMDEGLFTFSASLSMGILDCFSLFTFEALLFCCLPYTRWEGQGLVWPFGFMYIEFVYLYSSSRFTRL